MTTRRRLLIAPLAVAVCARPASARDAELEWRGHRADLSALDPARREPISAYLRQQIDLVASVAVRPDIKAWFPSVPIVLDPTLTMAGRYHGGRVRLDDRTGPPENPVLLHELMHAYMDQRLRRTGEAQRFYDAARAGGDWPAQSYMLSNLAEFFAMTASVALWGQAARPPGTRERLRAVMPDCYTWLMREFGLEV